jgi:hypothetical protein
VVNFFAMGGGAWKPVYGCTCLWKRIDEENTAASVLSLFPIKVITRTTSPTLCCSEIKWELSGKNERGLTRFFVFHADIQ